MSFDRAMFADKLQRYCQQLQIEPQELSERTGIIIERIYALMNTSSEPSGDEVLIFADFFKCDYRFFISNERLAPFEQMEQLFRKHGDKLTKQDRQAIQEFLFLCECEEFLVSELRIERSPFVFQKQGSYFKGHGQEAATALRRHLGYATNQVPMDIFADFRKIGYHVFRRRMAQSSISGLCIRYSLTGPCLLINYDEDAYRQRFSAAHEAAHAILDDDQEFVVSFTQWDKKDLSETRANTFASCYLIPPEFLAAIPNPRQWTAEKILEWAAKLKVNVQPLVYALTEHHHIDEAQASTLLKTRFPGENKSDPELPESLTPGSLRRKKDLLEKGLSDFYVSLCFRAYDEGIVSVGRLAEMLLLSESELPEIASIYGRTMNHEL